MANPQPDKFVKISSELLDELAKTKIPGDARQMFDYIIRKTWGYNIKVCAISTSNFIAATKLDRITVYRARKKLIQMNLITIYKNVDSQILKYAIQKDYSKWKGTVYKIAVSKNVDSCLQKRAQTVYKNRDSEQVVIDNRQSYRQGRFTPPSLEEVSKYCKERKNGINAQHFIDFYISKAWMIGKNKMKDWRAAVRTWEQRNPKPAANVRASTMKKDIDIWKTEKRFTGTRKGE